MLAFIGNFDLTELLVVAAVALMIFGKRLPEVALRAAAHVSKLRRQVAETWRTTGLDAELRRVKREIERDLPNVSDPRRFLEAEGRRLARRVEDPLAPDPLAPEPLPKEAERKTEPGSGSEPGTPDPTGSTPGPPESTSESTPSPPGPPGPPGKPQGPSRSDRESA